jgi:hypothetical protein
MGTPLKLETIESDNALSMEHANMGVSAERYLQILARTWT